MRLFISAIFILLIFNCKAQQWETITIPVNASEYTDVWQRLTYAGFKKKHSVAGVQNGDSVLISLTSKRELRLSLKRSGEIIDSTTRKCKSNNERIKIKTGWKASGAIPLLWALGFRSTSIKRTTEEYIVSSSFGAIAMLGLFPFTAGSPNLKKLHYAI